MGFGKQIEFVLKNATSAVLRLWLAQPEKKPDVSFKRILFIRYGGIGDMILSLPVFRAAKERFKTVKIDVLCGHSNAAPIRDMNFVDSINYYEKAPHKILKLIFTLRKKNYDYVCNLVPYPSFTFGILARLTAPHAVRVAADQKQYEYLYNRVFAVPAKGDIHMLERMCLLAADILGNEEVVFNTPWIEYHSEIKKRAHDIFSSVVKELRISSSNARIIAVNVTAKLKRREWPLNKYAEFLRIVIPQYKNYINGWVIFTDPNKTELTQELIRLIDLPSVVVIPPIFDYRVIMEFLRHILVLITPDTSFVHAASAMGTPVLDLMIAENVVTWDPIGVPHRIITSMDPVNLQDLPVQSVLDGFKELINEVT